MNMISRFFRVLVGKHLGSALGRNHPQLQGIEIDGERSPGDRRFGSHEAAQFPSKTPKQACMGF